MAETLPDTVTSATSGRTTWFWAHLRPFATLAFLGIIFNSSGITRCVLGGVVKTFRWPTQVLWNLATHQPRTRSAGHVDAHRCIVAPHSVSLNVTFES